MDSSLSMQARDEGRTKELGWPDEFAASRAQAVSSA